MHFFGYISSLAVAIGLLVFYIGNLTQCLILKIKEEPLTTKEIKVFQIAREKSSCFLYDSYGSFNGKPIKQSPIKNIVNNTDDFFNILQYRGIGEKIKYRYCFAHAPRQNIPHLFCRPPPVV